MPFKTGKLIWRLFVSQLRKQALVTGHRGFIGRHFFKALMEGGYDVLGADIWRENGICYPEDNAHYWYSRGGERFDVVIHAAAAAPNRLAIDTEPQNFMTNVQLDAAFIKYMAQHPESKGLYFSSSAVYPLELQDADSQWKLKEQFVRDDAYAHYSPADVYGWTKFFGERMATHAIRAGADIRIVRPFSGYGEDQSDKHPFMAIMKRVFDKEMPIEIWGDGRQVRDWIHVDDIVGASLRILQQPYFGPINLGTGRGVSMTELARMGAKLLGYEPEFKFLRDKPNGVSYRVSNSNKMHKIRVPRVSLEEGIARAMDHLAAA